MSEQSERNEPSEPSGSAGSGSAGSGSARSGSARSGSARQPPSTPASDMLSDLQRWLLRQSARSMGREVGSQVRRTLGGGKQQATKADVWDTATHEIPPEVGESPECQWCPICRAARRMREAGPGLGGQLSGAGDAVASVVQDAVSALDSILSRSGGSDERASAGKRPASALRSASDTAAGRARAGDGPAPGAGAGAGLGGAGAIGADGPDGVVDDLHVSVAGDHGPGGWKPGDRLATEHDDTDSWAGATEDDDSTGQNSGPAANAGGSPQGPHEGQLNGQQHEPGDRG